MEGNNLRYIYCHPFFDERKCAHRFSYELSLAFARTGRKLERFDYTGTGEAQGDFSDVTLDSLQQDIDRYVNGEEVCLVGLRLGASLALAQHAQEPNCVRNLVLLAPIINGDEYLEHMCRKQLIKDMMTHSGHKMNDTAGFKNIEGYQASDILISQLQSFDLLNVAQDCSAITKVMIVQIADGEDIDPRLQELTELLTARNESACIKAVSLGAFWERIPSTNYEPLTETIMAWCYE